jgi:hypothetical protein
MVFQGMYKRYLFYIFPLIAEDIFKESNYFLQRCGTSFLFCSLEIPLNQLNAILDL